MARKHYNKIDISPELTRTFDLDNQFLDTVEQLLEVDPANIDEATSLYESARMILAEYEGQEPDDERLTAAIESAAWFIQDHVSYSARYTPEIEKVIDGIVD